MLSPLLSGLKESFERKFPGDFLSFFGRGGGGRLGIFDGYVLLWEIKRGTSLGNIFGRVATNQASRMARVSVFACLNLSLIAACRIVFPLPDELYSPPFSLI